MSRINELQDIIKGSRFTVDDYSPGDGITRYRFFNDGTDDYFVGSGIFTALGLKEAKAFALGLVYGGTAKDYRTYEAEDGH